MIPVGDLLGKPVLHRRLGLGDERELAVSNLSQVLRHNVSHGVALRLLFQFAGNPRTLGPIENRLHVRFAFGQRPVVEIGCIMHMARGAIGVELHIEHPFGDDAAFTGSREARILNRMLEIEQHTRPGAGITFIHQHSAALQKIAVALKGEVDDRVEQRMARADEGGQRLTLRRHQRLFEGDALVARQHRFADADQTITVAHRSRNVGDLVAARLALLGRSAQAAEGFEEKRLDVVRLQAAGLGTLHIFADAVDAARVHGVMGKGMFFEQVLKLAAVERVIQHRRQAGTHLGLIAVADRLDQQVTQRFALELELAEHVEHLAAEGLAGLLQLLQQLAIDVAFAGLFGHQVPQVAHFGLTDAVDAAETLLECGWGSTAGRS